MSDTIATAAGREKLAKARAGIKPLPKCAYIALGDGGEDAGGTLKIPSDTATGLYQEVVRRAVEPPQFPNPTTASYAVLLTASEFAGVAFNEIGLFDDENTLLAIKTFFSKKKDGDMEMRFEFDDMF